MTTDDYMPMAISQMEEYDKVVNVSWYTPEIAREELTSVTRLFPYGLMLTVIQLPLRFTIFPNVPIMLHRHPELSQPILLFLR